MANSNDKKIKIALDSNVVIELASYILNAAGLSEDENPRDYAVYEELKQNKFNSSSLIKKYKGKKNVPFVLSASSCGMICKDKNGVERYMHLEHMARLYHEIQKGRLEVYITKTTLYEVFGAKEQAGWIIPVLKSTYSNGIINVIDDKSMTQMCCPLAKLYSARGIMEKTYDTENDRLVPSRDAYIMAQSSMLGLCLLTYNSDDFIHEKSKGIVNAWAKCNKIEQINLECGLVFDANEEGMKSVPKPMFPDQFLGRYYAFMNRKNGTDYETESNIKTVATIPTFDLNSINEATKRIDVILRQEIAGNLRQQFSV